MNGSKAEIRGEKSGERKNVGGGRLLLQLFLSFLKTGAFTFGGGYAMIALLQNEFVEKKQWIGKEEFADLLAVAESTPGPIAVNSATYIGYKMKGVAGAAVSTLGVILPSFVIIFLISLVFDAFLSLKLVAGAFRGIQACVVYLILSAGVKMLKSTVKDLFGRILLIAVIAVQIGFNVFSVSFSSIFLILISAAFGLMYWLIRGAGREGKV